MPSTDTVMSAQGQNVTIEQLGAEYLQAELDRKTAQKILDAAKARRDKAAAGLKERLIPGQVFTIGPNSYLFDIQHRTNVGYKGALDAAMAVADAQHRTLMERAVAANTGQSEIVKVKVLPAS